MEVKILVYKTPDILAMDIAKHLDHGFSLAGAVTLGINQNGLPVFVATLTKGESK